MGVFAINTPTRHVSVQGRGQAMCLLDRPSQLGPGARAAAQRRQVTLRLEDRRRRDRQAYRLAHERRGRVGRAFVE